MTCTMCGYPDEAIGQDNAIVRAAGPDAALCTSCLVAYCDMTPLRARDRAETLARRGQISPREYMRVLTETWTRMDDRQRAVDREICRETPLPPLTVACE